MKNVIENIFWNLPYKLRMLLYPLIKYNSYSTNQFLKSNTSSDLTYLSYYKYKVIFVHIPKCGGRSINKSLFGNLGGGHKPIRAYQLFMTKHDFERFFKFAIVRNPWDRVYSAYKYLKSGGLYKWDKVFAERNIIVYRNFEDFITHGLFKNEIKQWIHFKPQYYFICDINENIMVDYIGRFENLQEEYQFISEKLNIVSAPLKHINQSENKKSYKEVYTDEMKEIVASIYSKDIEMFNYEF